MTAPGALSSRTDQELVELALQRDESASRELVDRYREKVFAVVVRILDDSDHAESAWQETFIRVFRSLARYQPDRAFGKWIARIARNTALDKADQYLHKMFRIDQASDSDTDDDVEPFQLPDRRPTPLEVERRRGACSPGRLGVSRARRRVGAGGGSGLRHPAIGKRPKPRDRFRLTSERPWPSRAAVPTCWRFFRFPRTRQRRRPWNRRPRR